MKFKKINNYYNTKFNFGLIIKDDFWSIRDFSSKEVWILNNEKNQALVISIYDDKNYSFENVLKEFENSIVTSLGLFPAISYYRIFKKDNLQQYEWIVIINSFKIKFEYAIPNEKPSIEKDVDYLEVLSILNTIYTIHK